jgi:hypothetical protein
MYHNNIIIGTLFIVVVFVRPSKLGQALVLPICDDCLTLQHVHSISQHLVNIIPPRQVRKRVGLSSVPNRTIMNCTSHNCQSVEHADPLSQQQASDYN